MKKVCLSLHFGLPRMGHFRLILCLLAHLCVTSNLKQAPRTHDALSLRAFPPHDGDGNCGHDDKKGEAPSVLNVSVVHEADYAHGIDRCVYCRNDFSWKLMRQRQIWGRLKRERL